MSYTQVPAAVLAFGLILSCSANALADTAGPHLIATPAWTRITPPPPDEPSREPIDFLVSDSSRGRQFIELIRMRWTGTLDQYAERTFKVLRDPHGHYQNVESENVTYCGADAYRIADRYTSRPDAPMNVSLMTIIDGYAYQARYFRHADMTPIDGWENVLRSFLPHFKPRKMTGDLVELEDRAKISNNSIETKTDT